MTRPLEPKENVSMQKIVKPIPLVLALVLLLSLLPSGMVLAAGNAPTFEVGAGQGRPGDTGIEIPIYIKGNPGISSTKITVSFDSDRLELTGARISEDWTGQTSQSPSMGNPYILSWINGTAEYTVADSVFATLTFSIRGNAAPGIATIGITYDPDDVYDLSYENIDFAVQDGRITVSADTAEKAISVTKAEKGKLELALNGVPEGLLIVAAYNGKQMAGSAVTHIPTGATSAVATFWRALPETCTYKAFVLDKATFCPLLPATKLTP